MKEKFDYIKEREIKKSMICHTIDIPMYHCCVKIIFDKQAKQLEKDWNRTTSGFGGLTRNFLKEEGTVLISFPDKKPKLHYLVHELYHAVTMIMDNIGHKINGEDEPSAYLMSYLIKEYKKIKTPN